MKRRDCEKLIELVNNKAMMDSLRFYMEYRIDALKTQLVSAQTFDTVQRLQGAIEELKRIENLRDEVINPRD